MDTSMCVPSADGKSEERKNGHRNVCLKRTGRDDSYTEVCLTGKRRKQKREEETPLCVSFYKDI
jgi:hypothetical protein